MLLLAAVAATAMRDDARKLATLQQRALAAPITPNELMHARMSRPYLIKTLKRDNKIAQNTERLFF